MIRLGLARVSTSIPLITLSTGTPGGTFSAWSTSVARRYAEGIAATIRSATSVAVQAFEVTSIPSGSPTPGRCRRFSRRSRIATTSSRRLVQSFTASPRRANSRASAVPIPPAPRIATRFMDLARRIELQTQDRPSPPGGDDNTPGRSAHARPRSRASASTSKPARVSTTRSAPASYSAGAGLVVVTPMARIPAALAAWIP